MQLAAVEYLNISGLVIDFATSPVRTGNSFFAVQRRLLRQLSVAPRTFESRRLPSANCSVQQSSCYTEDSCRPAIVHSRQKQVSQISFHTLSFQKI